MTATAAVKSRLKAAIDAFEAEHNISALVHLEYVELHDLLMRFADEMISAAEIDGIEDMDAYAFDDLLSSITHFQDRVLETQTA